MQTTSDNNGKTPEPAPHAFPRWVWLAGAGGMLVIGWLFILITHSFHLTAPVVFVCLGYGAGVAAVYTLFRTGASAVSGAEDEDDATSWGRPVGARAELEREKRVLLKAIKEAEFDLQMGKLSKADADGSLAQLRVGDHVRVMPAHVDPTMALHDRVHITRGDAVIDTWAIDLRGW